MNRLVCYSRRIICSVGFYSTTRLVSYNYSGTTDQRNVKLKNGNFDWIGDYAPCFGISGSQVKIIQEPSVFFETLKDNVRQAKHRIVIASLYLGTGELEQELVNTIQHACEVAKSSGKEDFEVHLLLDYNRGSRGVDASSRTMLTPLLEEYENTVKVYLYHTPELRGLLKNYLPQRFDEIVGLTHMKIYLFDNSFIISGANLSDSYFTNRQDRYMMFTECKEMSDFFTKLVKAVGSFSFLLHKDNSTELPSDWKVHPYEDNKWTFKQEARSKIVEVLDTYSSAKSTQICEDSIFSLSRVQKTAPKQSKRKVRMDGQKVDTWVYPLIQMGPFGVNVDETVMTRLFHSAEDGEEIYLASGYFNMTEQYKFMVIQESLAKYNILTASPQANGFFGARGVAGGVPDAYTYIANQFFRAVCYYDQQHRVRVQEYHRDGWTFHVKGLWYYLSGANRPCMSIIGSANFGYRSVYRDLECQLAVVTNNEELQENLKQEHVEFYKRAEEVSAETFHRQDRHVPYWVRLTVLFVKNFF